MGVNNYQTILRVELNDRMCYSRHHLMVPENFYCWVAGSFKFNSRLKSLPLMQTLFQFKELATIDATSLEWAQVG